QNALGFKLGIQYRVNQNWLWGAFIDNPFKVSGNLPSVMPVYVEFGTSYAFSYQLLLAVSAAYQPASHQDLKIGVEYYPFPALAVRGGTSVNPFLRYVGVGMQVSKFTVDLASSFHSSLGVSPLLSVSYAY